MIRFANKQEQSKSIKENSMVQQQMVEKAHNSFKNKINKLYGEIQCLKDENKKLLDEIVSLKNVILIDINSDTLQNEKNQSLKDENNKLLDEIVSLKNANSHVKILDTDIVTNVVSSDINDNKNQNKEKLVNRSFRFVML